MSTLFLVNIYQFLSCVAEILYNIVDGNAVVNSTPSTSLACTVYRYKDMIFMDISLAATLVDNSHKSITANKLKIKCIYI